MTDHTAPNKRHVCSWAVALVLPEGTRKARGPGRGLAGLFLLGSAALFTLSSKVNSNQPHAQVPRLVTLIE